MARRISVKVSKEYIESLCEWLQQWAQKPDSLMFPQFLKKRGIGWSYFNYFLDRSPLLLNVYEITMATLCERWFLMGIKEKELPSHLQKIYLKYLNVYDQHARFIRKEDQKEIADAEIKSLVKYEKEDYSQEQLDELYQRIYDDNNWKKDQLEEEAAADSHLLKLNKKKIIKPKDPGDDLRPRDSNPSSEQCGDSPTP